jgi:hypothetical protein
MKARVAWLCSVALASIALLACSGTLPMPPKGSHQGAEPVIVPTMPPPGRVLVVGKAPESMKNPVWIDGEWLWTGRRWQWKDGRWEDAQPGQYYAAPLTLRLSDGTIAHYKGHWTKERE